MSAKPLWKISVTTVPEAEDAVAELLQNLLGNSASSYTDVETLETQVSVYLEKATAPGARLRAAVKAGLKRIKLCGLRTGAGRVRICRIKRENWAESWKRHFQPIEIGPELLVKAGWHRRRPKKNQAVVEIDPGLSFGTGQHPTTLFCLRSLTVARRENCPKSFLDIGTGSGILAIAAAKLGFAPVEAFDFDPEAVRIARQNARRNGVPAGAKMHRADLTKLPRRSSRRFDLICANLISNLLLAERGRILARLQPGGTLILAGILQSEFSVVQKNYESAGLKLVASFAENEWQSGAFRFG